MRTVKFADWEDNNKLKDGLFHQWGLEIDQGDSEERFNNFSVALIETDDGVIHLISPDKVTFTNKEDSDGA